MDAQYEGALALRPVAEPQALAAVRAVRADDGSTSWHSDAEVSGVMIGTPCYGGLVTSRYVTSALGTSQLLNEKLTLPDGQRLPVTWCLVDGESLIERARNTIIAKFMAAEPKLSHFIFIDADLEWEPRDVLRLIAHDLDVVFGIYPKKSEKLDFAFHPEVDENGMCRRNPVTGAIRIARGSTGFMCIKRRVFERMREAYPQLKYSYPDTPEDEAAWLYGFFEAYIENGVLWSEDYGFCNRWRALGGEVWCDPEVKLGHIGPKIYRGDVAEVYRPVARPAAEPTVEPAVETIRGWRVPAGDPWFGPQLRTEGAMDTPVLTAALARTHGLRCAVDVGAHIGTWTRPLAARFAQVIALEPNPAVFHLLGANIGGAAGGDNVQRMQMAAWDRREQLELRVGKHNSGETAVRPVNGAAVPDTAVCTGIPLDTLGLTDVDLLKIDVEGAELRVLQGAEELIRRWQPVVVLEEDRDGDCAAAVWLAERGYRETFRAPLLAGHPKDNVVLTPTAVDGGAL